MSNIVTAVYDPQTETLIAVTPDTIIGQVDIAEYETDDEQIQVLKSSGSHLLLDEGYNDSDFDCCAVPTEAIRPDAKFIWIGCIRDGYGQITNAIVTGNFDKAHGWMIESPEYYGSEDAEDDFKQVRFLQRWVVRV